jgi:acetoacetate decarboxylase
MTIRYGARSLDAMRNREVEATSVETWATTLVATYETDPEAVAAVLPPPLQPSASPLVRVTVATVDMGRGYPIFGAGTFAVHCSYDGIEGDYALVMPMTTEQAVIGGRETFGEPKKLAEVGLDQEEEGGRITGYCRRMGITFVEVTGTISGETEPASDRTRTSYYVKFLPAVTGKGFDDDPELVACRREERTRKQWTVNGSVQLTESRFDPVVDLPVRRLVGIELAERSSRQSGEVIARMSADDMAPFVHQRYDDLSPVGTD